MTKVFAGIVMAALLSSAASGQSAKPRLGFEVADVHPSPPIRNTTLSRVLEPVLLRAGIQGGAIRGSQRHDGRSDPYGLRRRSRASRRRADLAGVRSI